MWQVDYTPEARAQRATLGPAARRALDEAVQRFGQDPWQGAQYRDDYPREFRTVSFGTWGIVVYLIARSRAAVVLLEVAWYR